MKKILMGLLIGSVSISLLVGCSEQNVTSTNPDELGNIGFENSVAIFRGVIEEMSGNVAIVKPNSDQQHILASGDKVSVSLPDSKHTFAVGDEVVVYYTGELMESYPLQIHTVDVKPAEVFDLEMNETNQPSPSEKIAINIEGIVSEVNGDRITLESGQVIIINDETAFETQNIGEIVPINDTIVVGNYIQGFTLDDETANEVTALVINSNGVLDSHLIKDEILISVSSDFDGTITEELAALGVVSIENIFDIDDTLMYVVKTSEVQENIIEELEKIDYIKYAEFNQMTSLDPVDNHEITTAPMGSVMVNIEGVITEVSEDGKSFKLDTGKWVIITKATELGISGPNARPKDEQFFEETFRVGNSISGFTEDENAGELVAYAIYTNWNWNDPIK